MLMAYILIIVAVMVVGIGAINLVGATQDADIKPGDRVRAMLLSAMALPEVPGMDLPTTVQGHVVSVDYKSGKMVVQDNEGDWTCITAGAVKLSEES